MDWDWHGNEHKKAAKMSASATSIILLKEVELAEREALFFRTEVISVIFLYWVTELQLGTYISFFLNIFHLASYKISQPTSP